MKNNIIVSGVVGLIVGLALGFALHASPEAQVVGTATVGTTNSTQRIATKVISLASGSATSTSILNTDSTDRIVDEAFTYCDGVGTSLTAYSGAGLAALTMKAATTSTDAPAIVTNSNLALNVIVATSTPNSWISTSSPSSYLYETSLGAGTTTAQQAAITRVWSSGSYMTFYSNATNTAACTVGVRYYNH